MLSVCEEQRAPAPAIAPSRETSFCENALIIMKSSSFTLLKMHDGIAVLYMLELYTRKPVV